MATSKKSAPAKSAAKNATAPAKSAGTTPAKGGAAAGKAVAKGGAAKSGRAPNAAFMKPMTPSGELAAVVGSDPQPRSEITKRVWDYIKKNNLQDAQNRRQINADDKLRPVFGGKENVTMFEMTSLVNKHLKG